MNYNLESTFNHPKNYGMLPGGYCRANKSAIWYNDQYRIRSELGIQPNESILLVGAGFGWLAEDWIADGYGPICAVDTSNWIQSRKSQESNIEIYSLNVTNLADQNTIKNLLGITPGNKITWCITEDILVCNTDDDCLQISESLRNIGNNVVHISSSPSVTLPDHNWKTITEWENFLYPDKIVRRWGIL